MKDGDLLSLYNVLVHDGTNGIRQSVAIAQAQIPADQDCTEMAG